MGNQWAPKRAPSASLPQPGTGEDSSEGSSYGQERGGTGVNGRGQENGIFACMIFPLKEKNIHSKTHKSQPHSRKAISNPLQGGKRCQVRLILLTILY